MPLHSKALAAQRRLEPAGPDLGAVLARAHQLGHLPGSGPRPLPLKGYNLGLLCGGGRNAAVEAFRQAAAELGASAAVLAFEPHEGGSPRTIEQTASLLSRLYDAVACDGLPEQVVDALARTATVPVTRGYIAAAALADTWAAGLDGADPPQHKRRRVLQALVLQSMR